MVGRDDEATAPHARKGKKGFTVAPKPSTAPPEAAAPRRRTTNQAAASARKPLPPRSTNVVKSERPEIQEAPPPPPVLAASDRIEVIEWGARQGSSPAGTSSAGRSNGRTIVSTKRIEVEIDPARIMQIQQALVARGFLSGEPTGIYDDTTIEAMRQFQLAQKIDVTGYPTAHSLKRLGL